MVKFERVRPAPSEWEPMFNRFPDRIVFQSPAWVSFLAESQNAEPILAVLKEGDAVIGWFTGLIVRKLGLKILGSPFRGWSTQYMGFNLVAGVSRRKAVEALCDFAFRQLGCMHMEVTDPWLSMTDVEGLGFNIEMHATMEVDLTQSEETLLANMEPQCRNKLRQAQKLGVKIEEASDLAFADDFVAQFADVFAKQGLVPHFGAERIRALIKHVHPTGSLLLLRARDPQGHCIATGIYPALHETAYYNNGASWREFQKLRPNESLHWYAMRYWKQRGMRRYNMGGIMSFKQKFGGEQTEVPMIYKSRYRALERLRRSALPIGRTVLGMAWKLKRLGRRQPVMESDKEEQ